MTSLWYKFTEEQRKKLSDAKKWNKICVWRIPWNKWMRWVQVAWNKWIKYTDEQKSKLDMSWLDKWVKFAKWHVNTIWNWFKKWHTIWQEHWFKKWDKLTDDRKKQIGEFMKWNTNMRGRKHTEDAKEKNRQAHIGKQTWNKWIWDKTPENKRIRHSVEFLSWRSSVFMRDWFTCKKCNKKWWVNAHHILNFAQYPELRFAIDNWITLCTVCHNMFHKIYKTKNNNREQINEFIGQNC